MGWEGSHICEGDITRHKTCSDILCSKFLDLHQTTAQHHSKYLELDAGRHHNGSEGERVWTDGGDHDGGDIGMDHRSSRCHRIRCTSCRRRNYHTWWDTWYAMKEGTTSRLCEKFSRDKRRTTKSSKVILHNKSIQSTNVLENLWHRNKPVKCI